MNVKFLSNTRFERALPMAAAALFVLSAAQATPATASDELAMVETRDAGRQTAARTEAYTVSSGGIDVIFVITWDADGAVTEEARTWMLLPDDRGYRAYVTERKGATGEFVETARGELYDPDADGIADAEEANGDAPRREAALRSRPGT